MTALHFVLGGLGILVGLDSRFGASTALAIVYLVFAFGEMYLLMPFAVCPNCVYIRRADGRCISGMNIVLYLVSLFEISMQAVILQLLAALIALPLTALAPILEGARITVRQVFASRISVRQSLAYE